MKPIFTIAAISDIHIEKYSIQRDFFSCVNDNASLLIIGGDMNNGKKREVELFLELIAGVKIPTVVIFGNHDCDAGDVDRIKEILLKNKLIKIIDGEYIEYKFNGKMLGIAGAKGYGGGFAPYKIFNRGESATKAFVEEEGREVAKLQTALNQMKKASLDFKIVITHWAAFRETIEGEPKELYVILGSSRLGDAIEQTAPHLALSGHAHHGSQGIKKTRGNVSACNIAYKVNEGRMPLFDFFLDGSVSLRHLESH